MKTYTSFFASAALALMLCTSSCGGSHFIGDSEERATVEADFAARRDTVPCKQFFDNIDMVELSTEQREALKFLYAYMPMADIADHPVDYFIENIDYSFRAREEMPWGKSVPEREFRHFVLPVRVNNENLDTCRKVFYNELKERVQGLSMRDAVLEVNHWCHEKVTYRPSDARTSSPLASVKTAYGRCGEESTFTVSALRSVGIPARQVYTPRWAHTDNNHAWVEAWVDGKWYFFGACEPEPVLNLAWFNAPASRGMLMHTKVFGRYMGPEEVMYRTPRYTEINVIDNYAPTAKADVNIVDADGRPVPGAKVEFKVYNYGEFYSVATKDTDNNGKTFLTAGKGDMVVWASRDGRFGYSKVSFGKDSVVTISLDKTAGENYALDLDIIPPVEGTNLPEVTAEQRAENDRRFALEDSIRRAYEATFYTQEMGIEFAEKHNLNPEETVASMLVASRGNHDVITEFLASLDTDEKKAAGIDLLQCIAEKDLRDVKLAVLNDHLLNSRQGDDCSDELFSLYVRNPRVSNEMITPYKAFLTSVVPEDEQKAFAADPMKIVAWVADSIAIDPTCNLGGSPITPIGVWKSRVADRHSRNIFFVSLARAMGVPARIDEITGKVQIMGKEGATDVDFELVEQSMAETGRLVAKYRPTKVLDDPKYYDHFTISRITEDGRLSLLGYAEGAKWSQLLKNGLTLDAGNYLMVSGTRLANGGVLSHLVFFTIEPGKTTNVELVMRESRDEVQVIGSFDSESTYMPIDGDLPRSILSTTGRGYFVVGVLGVGQEPTNHALKDIAAVSKAFEQWGRKMVLLFPSEEQYRKFNPDEFPGLPSTITYGIDTDGAIQKQLREQMKLKGSTLPIFIIGDTFNRVVFCSHGYTIGIGEQMMKVAHKL